MSTRVWMVIGLIGVSATSTRRVTGEAEVINGTSVRDADVDVQLRSGRVERRPAPRV